MEDNFTVEQISSAFQISKQTIRNRCVLLGINPILHNGNYQYVLTKNEVSDVVDFHKRVDIPNVIYVHTTWEIRESKLNFM